MTLKTDATLAKEGSKRNRTNRIDNDRLLTEKIDFRPLKSCVAENYPKNSAIYEVIVSEEDFITKSDFLAKMGIYLKLARRP